MSATARLQKILKIKPVKKLELEPIPEASKETVAFVFPPKEESETAAPKAVIPAPTEKELRRWEAARTILQRTDEEGLPVEGWATRIELMKADGRLWYSEEDKLWHRRG